MNDKRGFLVAVESFSDSGERIQIPTKAIFNIEHEREGNTEEVEFQFK